MPGWLLSEGVRATPAAIRPILFLGGCNLATASRNGVEAVDALTMVGGKGS